MTMKKELTLLIMMLLGLVSYAADNEEEVYVDYQGLRFHRTKVQSSYSHLGGGLLTVTFKLALPESGQYAGDIVIPQKIPYHYEKELADPLFEGVTHHVEIDSASVTEAEFSFAGNTQITGVTYPETFRVSVFSECTNLRKVVLPTRPVFYNNSTPGRMFYGCKNLTEILNLSSLQTFGDSMFEGCSSLENVDLSSVTSIGQYAFKDCSSFYEVEIVNPVELGAGVFEGCSKLVSVSGLDKLKNKAKVPASLFKNCTSLTTVELPTEMTTIEASAFEGCINLKSIGVKPIVIGDNAFKDCKSIELMDLSGATSIGNNAFEGCKSLYTDGTVGYNPYLDWHYYEAVIHLNSLKSIGNYAFADCSELVEIDFGRSFRLSEYGNGLFANCTNLKRIIGLENCTNFSYVGEKAFYNCKMLTEITIPQANKFGPSSFEGCEHLKKVVSTARLENVKEAAFKNCRNLESMIFDNYSYIIAGDEAFYNCYKLDFGDADVILSDLGKRSFYQCYKLKAVSVEKDVIPEEAFYGCINLSKVLCKNYYTFRKGIGVERRAFNNCKELKVFDGWIANAGEYAFYGCRKLPSVVWLSNMGNIEPHAFEDNSSLSRITILNQPGSEDKSIGYAAFFRCYNIEDIYHAGVSAFPKLSNGAFSKHTEDNAVLYAAYKNDDDYHNELNSLPSWKNFEHKGLAYYEGETDYNGTPVSPIFCREKYFHLLNASFMRKSVYNIPDKIKKKDGEVENYHSVIGIERKAFADNHLLRTLHLPIYILTIEGQSFANCSSLKYMEVVYGSPIKFDSNLQDDQPFEDINFDEVTLYIPKGTKYTYERANEWRKFKNMEEKSWAPQYWSLPDDYKGHEHGGSGKKPKTKPYVVYKDSTLTFYYDAERDSRGGRTFDLYEGNNSPEWIGLNANVTKSVFDSSFEGLCPTSTASWFSGCKAMEKIEGLELLNTTEVTDMSNMFNECSSLDSLVFGKKFFTTDSVNVENTFYNCNNIKTITFTDNIPDSINSKLFTGIGTVDAPARLVVPEEYRDNYAAKFNGNMFFGGYFKLSDDEEGDEHDPGIAGDLSADGEVNSTDLVILVNMIMGRQTKIAAADLNGDGEVNSTDLVMLVNKIMNK